MLFTYQDNVSVEKMAEVCIENYDKEFRNIAKAGYILCHRYLSKIIPLVVAGSFGSIFGRLMGVEVLRLVQRLRETFRNSDTGAEGAGDAKSQVLTRLTDWRFLWDVRRSKVTVTEGEGGPTWSQKVGELPPSIQEIIARVGLRKMGEG
ncbi:hypothetical protein E0Z10_g4855 [Xylaria hypoxylon]|uniref:Uncharacterized protein n=1 Tax=Xylaria hypoxylon TaxID=37992 RepID=A0A4Z0YXN8_9PEZI|nr:hypothetical protein E0Z10_g4855 [Xylaria hypoxylon]